MEELYPLPRVTHRLRLDLLKGGSQGCIRVKRSENGARRLAISLYANSVPYTPNAEHTRVVFRAIKPDGTNIYNAASITDNTVTVNLTTQTVTVLGAVKCELSIYGNNNTLLYSPQFEIVVEDYLYSDDAVESTDEFTALTEAISDIDELSAEITRAEEAREEAENERADAERAREEAEAAREAIISLWENVTAEAQTADEVSVELATETDHKNFKFGLPSYICKDTIEAGELLNIAGTTDRIVFYALQDDLTSAIAANFPDEFDAKSFLLINAACEQVEAPNSSHGGIYECPQILFDGINIYARRLKKSIKPYGLAEDTFENFDWTIVGTNNSNIRNGAKKGSLRGVGAVEESDSYKLGLYAQAFGYLTEARGDYSHAEGSYTKAASTGAHAEGISTKASGSQGAHAEGSGTTAAGMSSHAEGASTQANAAYSHAEGRRTIANGVDQHVQGRYNMRDESVEIIGEGGKYAHIVGNGTAESNRSNAHTLEWSGDAWYQGNVYVGSTSGKNRDSGSKVLATKEYVDSMLSDKNLDIASALRALTETNTITPVADASNSLYIDNDGKVYTI